MGELARFAWHFSLGSLVGLEIGSEADRDLEAISRGGVVRLEAGCGFEAGCDFQAISLVPVVYLDRGCGFEHDRDLETEHDWKIFGKVNIVQI